MWMKSFHKPNEDSSSKDHSPFLSGLRVPLLRRRGRILGLKFGVNPNSSSIGSDLSVLLIGTIALTVVVNLLDSLVRGRLFNKTESKGDEDV